MVILATKLYGADRRAARQSLEQVVADRLEGLEVDAHVGVRSDGFPSVTLEGPDATAARNLLAERWGSITETFEEGDRYWGTLEWWSDDGFHLDAGASVTVPPSGLDLGPGSPEQVATRFGLVEHLPMRFVHGDPPRLADIERDRLYGWRRGDGRVTANGITRSQLRATINRRGHAGDIVTVERLGLLEQSVICRESTDPPGLLASIGPYVPGDLACVVPATNSPRQG